MASPQFGAIERKPLRDFWSNEAADFTPWLASDDNLPLLSDAIGLDLELESSEVPVGPYSADIVCRSIPDGHRVVIENQLERTDHDHLGKLLTYAAGLGDVSTVVWIARDFTEQHRAALDWLNRSTVEDVRFFGIEIEVWQIGDSLPAPRFTLISEPNEWAKTKPQPGLTPARERQLAYWTAFKQFGESAGTRLRIGKPLAENWTSFGVGRSGITLVAVATKGDPRSVKLEDHIRVELLATGDNRELIYKQLEQKRDRIESELGTALVWAPPGNRRTGRMYFSKDADVTNRDDWPNQHRWLLEWLQKFDDVFRPLVQNLDG